MLRFKVVTSENFDEETSEFIEATSFELELEHSLVSLSKWESEWEIPFLSSNKKTMEQVQSYILCMDLRGDLTIEMLSRLSSEHFDRINKYIDAKRTATTVREPPRKGPSEVVTSELIYYWMTALAIPVEFENWHLYRLLTLIKVCNIKNSPGKNKMSPSEVAAQNKSLNEQRRRETGSKG